MERIVGSYIFDPEMTARKMIFLSGPRQVGKTTFARMWLEFRGMPDMYFNWDDPEVMVSFRENPLYFHNIIDNRRGKGPLPVVFDEIHRYRGWSDVLKGIHDARKEKIQLLVTGSGKLELFLKSGDSLIGRHFTYSMFPLGLPEVLGDFSQVIGSKSKYPPDDIFSDGGKMMVLTRDAEDKKAGEGLEALMKFGGFPEPFIKASEKFHRRWQKSYRALVTREEVRDLSRVQDIKGIETLAELLPARVGSPLSIPSLCEDIGKKYDTIHLWITVLENLQMVFTIMPWHGNIARAIRKERKLYFYDWSVPDDNGIRFENLIAVALVRMAARFTETGLGDYDVRYVRDKEKRKVDFILVKDRKPVALFEAKEGERSISPHGKYFSARLHIPYYQIVRHAERAEKFPDNCFILPAAGFLMLTG